MTIAIKPTASGSTIEQNGSTILTVDGSGNITPSNQMYPKVPAFSAKLSSNQTISAGTWTKAEFSNEQFDTNSNYDNSTNYRFTPTVAGYYLININARFTGVSGTSNLMGSVYVNGTRTTIVQQQHAQTDDSSATGVNLIYLNGSTDYIECYVYTNNGDLLQSAYSFFQAHLVSV